MTFQPYIDLQSITEETQLQSLSQEILQDNINRYAEASKDFNPIHIDESFARSTALGGTIAHGMLILAYITRMLTSNFGKSWLQTGKLNVRFKTPARPGDKVTISGAVKKVDRTEFGSQVRADVVCRNQGGETIISGESVLTFNNR